MKRGDAVTTDRLTIRNWNPKQDADAFYRLNNDPRIMRFFPGRRTYRQALALFALIDDQMETNGYSWSAICLKSSGNVIGFGGLAKVSESFPHGPSTEIGWRFLPEYWGCGYATEMGNAMLRYGFETLHTSEIISFAVVGNSASFAVMERLGMQHDTRDDFDHPDVDTTLYPKLVRHGCCRLNVDQWRKRKQPD